MIVLFDVEYLVLITDKFSCRYSPNTISALTQIDTKKINLDLVMELLRHIVNKMEVNIYSKISQNQRNIIYNYDILNFEFCVRSIFYFLQYMHMYLILYVFSNSMYTITDFIKFCSSFRRYKISIISISGWSCVSFCSRMERNIRFE